MRRIYAVLACIVLAWASGIACSDSETKTPPSEPSPTSTSIPTPTPQTGTETNVAPAPCDADAECGQRRCAPLPEAGADAPKFCQER